MVLALGKQNYGLLCPATVLAYDQAASKDFRYTIKCHNALTLPFAYGLIRLGLTFSNRIELFMSFYRSIG